MGHITNPQELIGQKFNRLTITEHLGMTGKKRMIIAKCECGVEREYVYGYIKNGYVKSCGCQRTDSNRSGHNTQHGLTKHPLHQVWTSMKDRCNCVTDSAYPNYGGSGVVICEEWNEFQAFYDWAMSNGYKKGLQLDKDKLSPFQTGIMYSPEFCCFITRKENMRHRRNTILIYYENENKSLPEWCDILKLSYHLTFDRLKRGWEPAKAFSSALSKNWNRQKRINKTTLV